MHQTTSVAGCVRDRPLGVVLDHFEGLQLSHTSRTVIGVLLNQSTVTVIFLLLFQELVEDIYSK